MRYYFLLISLFSITTITPMMNLPKEVIVYKINPILNRVDKNSLKCTNKKLYTLIYSQATLNKEYNKAFQMNDTITMKELLKKGALHLHEEIYNLFTNKEQALAQKVWRAYKYNAVSCCIPSIFSHGITANNTCFIQWLLDQLNPPYDGYLIKNGLSLAKDLKLTSIEKILTLYITEFKAITAMTTSYHYYSLTENQQKIYNLIPIPL